MLTWLDEREEPPGQGHLAPEPQLALASQFWKSPETKAVLMPWEVVVQKNKKQKQNLAPSAPLSKAFPRSLCGRTACKAGVCKTLAKMTCIFNSVSPRKSLPFPALRLSLGRQVGGRGRGRCTGAPPPMNRAQTMGLCCSSPARGCSTRIGSCCDCT